MKKKLAILLSMIMILTCFAFTACGGSEEPAEEQPADSSQTEEATDESEDVEEPFPDALDGGTYGYIGDDPEVLAVYEYLTNEVAPLYDDGAENIVSVPVVQIIDQSKGDNGETLISGDFWIFNYEIDGDILKMVSGGAHPGRMHVAEDGEIITVVSFDPVEDGGNLEPSAKEIFGDKYEEFMAVSSDDKTREAERAATLANFVKANSLKVTKYQDYGQDPVDIPL